MQAFSTDFLTPQSQSLPAPPSALAEAANFLTSITGCEFPDALAVALSILAGTGGPIRRIVSPRGTQYSGAINAYACVPPGKDISGAVADLRASLDNEFGTRIDERAARGVKSLTVNTRRAYEALREKSAVLENFGPVSSSFGQAAALERRTKLEEEAFAARRDFSDARFLERPWIIAQSLENLDALAEDAFDHGLFIQPSDTARASDHLMRHEGYGRIISAGFTGTAISLDSRRHFRPCVSNLWIASTFPGSLLECPAMQTFMVADMGGSNYADEPVHLGNWHTLLAVIFNTRLQQDRSIKSLTRAAAQLYLEREKKWRQEIRAAPPSLFAAMRNLPVQALKIALHCSTASMIDTGQEPDAVDEEWVGAGFDYTENLARRLTARELTPSRPVELDITHLVNRLLRKGPMHKRDLVRSYHKANVSEMNAWLAEGVKRGILQVDGSLVRLVDPSVSVSARQHSESTLVSSH